jgi:hypothetical protein
MNLETFELLAEIVLAASFAYPVTSNDRRNPNKIGWIKKN